jgi:thiol-disulfide isomerase/thioredoxin
MSLSLLANGQTIVSTSPENKNVVLEEFTGINCGYCPQGHAIANQISAANPDRVVVINIHVGGFATPSAGQPDFRTPFGTSIANQSALTGYPAGTVNRHVFSGLGMSTGGTAMGRGNWSNASNQILAQSSYVNIGATAEIDITTRELTVYVEAYYTANGSVSTNKLNIALMQNNTIGYQSGGSANYNHMHRLVHLLTNQWGETISQTTSGTLYTNTFKYTIPENYNSIPALLGDMEVAVFIAESNQEVITGIKVEPTFTNAPNATDFTILSAENPPVLSTYAFSPKFKIRSFGGEPLTSLLISYSINEEEAVSYEWTGNVTYGQSETITLPETPFYLLKPNNSITINILTEDPSPSNNIISQSFSKSPISLLNDLIVEVRTDQYGTEISWNIKNASNAIVSNGGPYSDAVQTQTKNVNLPNGYYVLTINDSYGDGILGGGYIKLKNASGDLFTIAGNSFSSTSSMPFKVTQTGELEFNVSDEFLTNGSVITVTSEKILAESNWSLLLNENISNYITLQYQVSKEGIEYIASIEPLEKTITITINQELEAGSSIEFSFGDGLIDEDGLAILPINQTFSVTGLSDNALPFASLYPNPTNGSFSINVPSVSGNVAVSIYSVTGSLVMSKLVPQNSGRIDMNISQPKGVYYITLTLEDGKVQTLKLVIK